MRIVRGKHIEEMTAEAFRLAAAEREAVLVDIGAGSGQFVCEAARRLPGWLCVALDAEARNFREASSRTRRKPSRGGLENALFVLAPAEAMPPELAGAANHITIFLPWGSLLRAAVLSEPGFLKELISLAAPGAAVEMLLCYSEKYEPAMMRQLGLPPLTEQHVLDVMAPAWRQSGLEISRVRALDNADLRLAPLGWGRLLAKRRPRQFLLVMASAGGRCSVAAEPESLLLSMSKPAVADAADQVRVTARGSPSILGLHDATIEVTRDPSVTERGDCIIGVAAEFDAAALAQLLNYRKLHVHLRCGGAEESFTCGVNGQFVPGREIVFRKSSFRSERTLGVRASKAANQLSRGLIQALRQPGSALEMVITPAKPFRA